MEEVGFKAEQRFLSQSWNYQPHWRSQEDCLEICSLPGENRFVLLVHSCRGGQHWALVLGWEGATSGKLPGLVFDSPGWMTDSEECTQWLGGCVWCVSAPSHGLSAAFWAVSKQVLGQQRLTQKPLTRTVGRERVLRLQQVSSSYPLSYFSLLAFVKHKLDRFCFIDAISGLLRKMSQKKVGFLPVPTQASELNLFTGKKKWQRAPCFVTLVETLGTVMV